MNRSEQLLRRAVKHIPGGVNSPVRAFRAVGGSPRFIKKGKGAYVWDADGKRYLDFVMSWGPLILGHADPGVVKSVQSQAAKGTSYGAPTENEVVLAELIKSAFPSIEKVRLVSSGTEAVMSAIRLARGATGRKKILKIDGGYHGHADSLLIRAGSGAAAFGVPNSQGVPEELAKLTISIPFNDLDALERALKKHGREIACFILEPVPANMGVVLPKAGYLKAVRGLTKKYGVLLIFDEVITGFRLAFGGAQELFGVQADLTCLGKILGGGLPIGAFGGRADLMNHLAPLGKVYQAGTLSGNPIATAAGIATLERLRCHESLPPLRGKIKMGGVSELFPPHLYPPPRRGEEIVLMKRRKPGMNAFYGALNEKCEPFYSALESELQKRSLPVTLNRIGSMFTVFFTEGPVTDFRSAKKSDPKKYARFFHKLLARGIYFAPSQFEANFVSSTHQSEDLNRARKIISQSL